jgi:Zinc carboxypeptidase
MMNKNMKSKTRNMTTLFAFAAAALGSISATRAQEHIEGKVEIAWNRYYDSTQMTEHMKAIAKAYPEICRLEKIGETLQGRPMYVAIVSSPKTGPDTSKPGMWIDGNVHGNEIQAAEAVLYSIWYLTKAYGHNEDLTELLDNYSFYFLPSQNPDGRQYWFDEPNTPSSSRSNQLPVDDDRDGLLDEDTYDDLDGDGHITSMWKQVPDGQYRRNVDDPRIFERVGVDEKGDWIRLGSEGIDNDGDGRLNEDSPGYNDMNRNWPTDWQPTYIQGGAGVYPFSHPETKAIGEFILAHPNIAAGQSYHNSGGMILSGPGASYLTDLYPASDRRVYNEIANKGEDILPYYRNMIIYDDLYTVHGGFVNWIAEGLGILSFTNELWSAGKYFQRDVTPNEERTWLWRDRLVFGQVFTDYTEFDHPQYGKILVGGTNKWSGRNTPTFMLEEECHRNFAFTMYHADNMPMLEFERYEVRKVEGADGVGETGLWAVTVQIRNTKAIPTRLALARNKKIGTNDLLICEPGDGATLVTAGRVGGGGRGGFRGFGGGPNEWFRKQMSPVKHEPGRIQIAEGIGSRSSGFFRFIVRGGEGATITLRYEAEKAKDIETTIELRETETIAP